MAKTYMREFDKLESKPASSYDPSEGMNEEQLHSFVRFLFEQLTSLKDTLNAVKEELVQSNRNNKESQTIMNALQKLVQLFAYRNDGNYAIDNMAAERALKPMTVQRKNSLSFRSTNGANRSAIYNTFIETCKACGISFQQYFVKFITEINKGRTDYENLLPMTISLT